MLNLDTMVTAVNFIEDHLQENIKVGDMADAVSYSLFHFCRTFNKIVHHSPYDYLIRRRLSESARLLLETEQRITDIAFTFQFNSLETYSRAFKRLFGQLPSEWKKEDIRHAYRMMPRFTSAYLEQRNQPDFIRHEPSQREALQLAGLMSWIDGDEQAAMSQLWANLAAKLHQPPPHACYGLRWLSESAMQSSHFYMAVRPFPLPRSLRHPSTHVRLHYPYLAAPIKPDPGPPFCIGTLSKMPHYGEPFTLGYICAGSERIITYRSGSYS